MKYTYECPDGAAFSTLHLVGSLDSVAVEYAVHDLQRHVGVVGQIRGPLGNDWVASLDAVVYRGGNLFVVEDISVGADIMDLLTKDPLFRRLTSNRGFTRYESFDGSDRERSVLPRFLRTIARATETYSGILRDADEAAEVKQYCTSVD